MRKAIPFRYEEELEKDIKTLKELTNYGMSINRAITFGIKIGAAYARKLFQQKSIKDEYALRAKIEEKLNIELRTW